MTVSAPESARGPLVEHIDLVGRPMAEDLLYLEADLLDRWNLDDWLLLYTEDARYVVPATDTPDGDPDRELVLIDDDRLRMTSRVGRLNSRRAHREFPHSRTRHLVTNVRLGAPGGGVLPVTAGFAVFRFRNGREVSYVGRYTYGLTVADGRLLIRHKRVELDLTALRPAYDVAIIL